ncbi:MAG: hypothetical protein WBF45_04740 [Acidobacteriaceae bacterium]
MHTTDKEETVGDVVVPVPPTDPPPHPASTSSSIDAAASNQLSRLFNPLSPSSFAHGSSAMESHPHSSNATHLYAMRPLPPTSTPLPQTILRHGTPLSSPWLKPLRIKKQFILPP